MGCRTGAAGTIQTAVNDQRSEDREQQTEDQRATGIEFGIGNAECANKQFGSRNSGGEGRLADIVKEYSLLHICNLINFSVTQSPLHTRSISIDQTHMNYSDQVFRRMDSICFGLSCGINRTLLLMKRL